MSLEQTINHLLSSDKYHAFFSIVKGVRNGIFYGTKIRFPHALVMTFLFREGTLKEKFTYIIKATIQHATNLAKFSFLYKLIRYAIVHPDGNQTIFSRALMDADFGPLGRNQHPARLRERTQS